MIHVIHCDGAAAPSNPGPSSFGATIHKMKASEPLFEKAEYSEMSGFLGHGTNQTAELNAAIHSLKSLPEGCTVVLVSDSQYVLKGLTEWRKGWEAKGWKNSQKRPVANKDLWVSLFAEYDRRKVTCKWVRGHTGNEFNERADFLATRALIDAGALPKDYLEQSNLP